MLLLRCAEQRSSRICRLIAHPICGPHMPNNSSTLSLPLKSKPVSCLHFTAEEMWLQWGHLAQGHAGAGSRAVPGWAPLAHPGRELQHPEDSLPGKKGRFGERFACQKSTVKKPPVTSKASLLKCIPVDLASLAPLEPGAGERSSPQDDGACPLKAAVTATHGTKSTSDPDGVRKRCSFPSNTKSSELPSAPVGQRRTKCL